MYGREEEGKESLEKVRIARGVRTATLYGIETCFFGGGIFY